MLGALVVAPAGPCLRAQGSFGEDLAFALCARGWLNRPQCLLWLGPTSAWVWLAPGVSRWWWRSRATGSPC